MDFFTYIGKQLHYRLTDANVFLTALQCWAFRSNGMMLTDIVHVDLSTGIYITGIYCPEGEGAVINLDSRTPVCKLRMYKKAFFIMAV